MDNKQVLGTSIGIVMSLAFLEYYAKNTNTKENRKNVLKLINNNLYIQGFSQLHQWLTVDGFVDGIYNKPADINNNTVLKIGSGGGMTKVGGTTKESVDTWLRNLTAGGLRTIVDKAINLSPVTDSTEDRQLVLKWVESVKGKIKNMDVFASNLSLVGWVSKNPSIPQNTDIPISLLLGDRKRIYDYHKFLLESDTEKVLKLVDGLVFPDDPDLEDREYTFLKINESSGVVGFTMFAQLVQGSGFIASPQQFNVPDNLPDTLLLGGLNLTKTELTSLFEKASVQSINAVVESALQTFDPTLQPRIGALASLAQTKDNYVNTTGFTEGCHLSDLYIWLKGSGFTSSPRTFHKVDTSKFTGTFYSFGWFSPKDDIQTFLANATAEEVSDIATLGGKTGIAYNKYLAIKTGMNIRINNAIYGAVTDGVGVADIMTESWVGLYQVGSLYSPPVVADKDILNNVIGTKVVGGVPLNEMFSQPGQAVGLRVPFGSNEPVSSIVNYLFSGSPSSDLLLTKFWIGNDPADPPMGMLVKTDVNGKANQFFSQDALNVALAEAKAGKDVLLPP